MTLVSTTFIVLSGVSLIVGWWFIRFRREITAHRNTMLVATTFAGLFLVAYVTRWAVFGSKHFQGTGFWKGVYIANLIPHIILAVAVGPLALRLIWLALAKRDFEAHRRLARITLPIWLYVAGSGWLVWYMLYRWQF
jgi:putative membrane protein